jgi:hypothetical protein
MKININYTIEIDETMWAKEYGLRPEEVRQDVKEYCETIARLSYNIVRFTAEQEA